MSRLDSIVVMLVVQITIPLSAALALSRRRSHAAASRSMAWGAIVVLLLTLCAFLPLPSWSLVRPESSVPVGSQSEASDAVEDASEASPASSSGSSAPGIDLSRLLRTMRIEPARSPESATHDRLTLGGIGLAILGAIRFGIGWIALIRTRRRSFPAADGELRTVLASVCSDLGCRKRVEVRQSSRIGSAAALGWFRPTILISTRWREWTATELRAILAHEVAHILRRDFQTRFLARLVGAIHAYHPLVRWLIRRLELRQELAADAVAAPCVGGSSVYIRCLASLALKADGAKIEAVPTFHTRPDTLLRRIAMLQVKDDKRTPSPGWWSAAMVAVLGVPALGLHGGSSRVEADPTTPSPTAVVERDAIDVSLLALEENPDTVGFYSLRLGSILELPGMDKLVGGFFAKDSPPTSCINRLTEIERIVGRVSIKVEADKPAPNHTLMMSLEMVQFKNDVDWAKEIEQAFGKSEPCKRGEATYFEIKPPVWLAGLAGTKKTMNLYPVDRRTLLVGASAETIEKCVERRKSKPQPAKWREPWLQVAGNTLAIVLTEAPKRLKEKLTPATDSKTSVEEKAMIEAFGTIVMNSESPALGFDLGKSLTMKIRLKARTPEDLPTISRQCEAIGKILKSKMEENSPDRHDEPPPEVVRQIVLDLLKKASLRRVDQNVVIDSESPEAMKALNQAMETMATMKE